MADRSRKRDREKRGAKPSPDDETAPFLARAWHQISPIALAVAIALLIRALVLESFYVPSGSMLPTFLIGDHVFVSKFTYGARIPFTDIRAPALRAPRRGEIVIFELGRRRTGAICPADLCPKERTEDFVKRIVGIPGDTIEVRDGRVILNDVPVPVEALDEDFVDDDGQAYRTASEQLGDVEHAVLDHPALPSPAGRRITIPEGRYFMMGDNRDNSNDSRSWGTVRREEIKGPVVLIYWSWNNRGSWLSMLNPWTWVKLLATETRWSRFGDRPV